MKNETLTAGAGKRGEQVRSDCYIELSYRKFSKNSITIKSKVSALYGDAIHAQMEELLSFFELKGVQVSVEDAGALPFVLSARFESAVKRLFPDIRTEFFTELLPGNDKPTTIDRLRRSRLYLPGNEPKFFINAGLHGPDALILDLEDSVAPPEKDSARILVRNALRSINFYGCERMVRINQFPLGYSDLDAILPHNVHVILIPKVESPEDISKVEDYISIVEEREGIQCDSFLMPIIESAGGVMYAREIASSSPRICALAIGLEDYTADIGTQRTLEGKESYFARSAVVNAAKAAGIQAIDTVFSDVTDMEGLRASVIEAKSLGFEGKGVIHPRQVKVVHEALAPTTEEIEKAKKIVLAFEDAKQKGLGVVALGSKMIDAPVVKRAQRTISLAIQNKLIPENWIN